MRIKVEINEELVYKIMKKEFKEAYKSLVFCINEVLADEALLQKPLNDYRVLNLEEDRKYIEALKITMAYFLTAEDYQKIIGENE